MVQGVFYDQGISITESVSLLIISMYISSIELSLIRGFISLKRQPDHENAYKGKHLMGWLTVSEV